MNKSFDLKVFISNRESICEECHENLRHHAWITLEKNKGAFCLSCADLDHLVFLPAGDAALTRRARKHSELSALVLKWSSARKRYERQGLLVEEEALERAEKECLADKEARERQRKRGELYRAQLDQKYIEQFALRVREVYPGCPSQREFKIAEHACQKYSGRIGRSAAAKSFDEEAIRLAVIAHIRHNETAYDSLLNQGYDRFHARSIVQNAVNRIMTIWIENS